jgi:hypothetical protein
MCASAVCVALWAASACHAGELATLGLKQEPLTLLRGRVSVKMPEGARIEARKAANIMAADPSTDEETRVVLDAGNERLVLMASETFQWADENFAKALGKEAADCLLTPMPGAGGAPPSYLAIPKSVKPGGAATPVAYAYLVTPDKTVVRLTVYVNPAACADLAGCTALAKAVLATAAAGNVSIRRPAETRRLRAMVANHELEVSLPKEYVVTLSRGPDFWVYYVYPLSPYGNRPGSLLVYQGAHPRTFHGKAEEGEGKPEAEKSAEGAFLGKKTTWKTWSEGTGDQARTCAETMVSVGALETFHVYYWAHVPDLMKELDTVAQSMKLAPKAPGPASPAGAGAPQ